MENLKKDNEDGANKSVEPTKDDPKKTEGELKEYLKKKEEDLKEGVKKKEEVENKPKKEDSEKKEEDLNKPESSAASVPPPPPPPSSLSPPPTPPPSGAPLPSLSPVSTLVSAVSSTQIEEAKLRLRRRKRPDKWIIRCSFCHKVLTKNEALTNDVICCLKRFWHRAHFNCNKCGVPIGTDERDFRANPHNEHQPLCIDCFMDDYHPPCEICGKALRETCVVALDKRMHRQCFTCMRCGSPFPGRY